MPKKAQAKPWKNITIREDEAQALMQFQQRLAGHLGFEPTISQTVRWLITNSQAVLASAQRAQESNETLPGIGAVGVGTNTRA